LDNSTMELGIYTSAAMTPDPGTGRSVSTAAGRPAPRAFLTGTVYEGRKTLRACILHPETDLEHLETLVAEILASAHELAHVAAA
jgi:hypothetical protein